MKAKLSTLSAIVILGLNAQSALAASINSFAAVLECVIPSNAQGVIGITFSHPVAPDRSLDGFFNAMQVSYSDGSVRRFNADSKNTITGMSLEEDFSVFSTPARDGYATVRHTFFVLPQDDIPHRRVPRNGVKMKIILPPATEELSLECVRK